MIVVGIIALLVGYFVGRHMAYKEGYMRGKNAGYGQGRADGQAICEVIVQKRVSEALVEKELPTIQFGSGKAAVNKKRKK